MHILKNGKLRYVQQGTIKKSKGEDQPCLDGDLCRESHFREDGTLVRSILGGFKGSRPQGNVTCFYTNRDATLSSTEGNFNSQYDDKSEEY